MTQLAQEGRMSRIVIGSDSYYRTLDALQRNPVNSLAFGGGTNSLGVLIGLKELGLQRWINLITFSDTKGEKPETYDAVDRADAWVRDNGFRCGGIVTLRTISPDRGFEGLEGMAVRLGTLPSKAFGYKSCSQRFKIEPQQKFMNHWELSQRAWKNGKKVTQIIGYDAGEPQRAKTYTNDKYDFFYPLIEWGWGRDECVDAIQREGLPLPGKSACFFCPSMRKPEVIRLSKEHPELFDRAVAMERGALSSGKLGVVKGLGRHWSWEELVKASEPQRSLFPENSMGIDCACFDGEPDEDDAAIEARYAEYRRLSQEDDEIDNGK